jgi:hypothetical protein
MRLLLAIFVLINSLPLPAPARAASVFTPAAGTPTNSPREDPTPEPSPTPTPDPVLEQAQREAKLAEELKKKAVSDKERAEAEAARLKTTVQPLGAPANVTVPTGSVTTDAAGWVESQMLAQEAARQISSDLSYFLCREPITPGNGRDQDKAQIKTLVIYNNSDLVGVELFGSVKGQLGILRDELDTKNLSAMQALVASDPKTGTGVFQTDGNTIDSPLALFAAPGIATGLIKSAAELINLFRTDTTFTNKAITLSEDVVVSYIVEDLTNKGFAGDKPTKEDFGRCPEPVRVYYPALYAPRLLQTSDTSPLIQLLNEDEKAKNLAASNVEKLEARVKALTKLSGMADDLKTKTEKDLPAKDKELAEAGCNRRQRNSDKCKKLRDERDKLVKAIDELKEGLDGVKNIKEFKGWIEKLNDLKAKMQALVTATTLVTTKLNTPDENSKLTAVAQLLRAERLHAIMNDDGTYTLRVGVKANGTTKVKKNLFVDAKVRHSAGADLTYQLFDKEGVIAQANSLQCYIEYQSSRNVQNIVSGVRNNVQCNSNAVGSGNGGNGNAKGEKGAGGSR